MNKDELEAKQKEEARKLALEQIRSNAEREEKRRNFEDWKASKILKCDKCGKSFNALGSQLSWRKTCGPCYYAAKKEADDRKSLDAFIKKYSK